MGQSIHIVPPVRHVKYVDIVIIASVLHVKYIDIGTVNQYFMRQTIDIYTTQPLLHLSIYLYCNGAVNQHTI